MEHDRPGSAVRAIASATLTLRPAFLAFFAIILLITGGAWLIAGSFVHDLVPGGWRVLLAVWALSVAPLFVLARNLMGGGYPSAMTRIWLLRPFWYAQLLALTLAFTSVAGFVVGLPFGEGARAGRWTVLSLAPALVVLAFWGFAGTRRLVVRHLDVMSPSLPAALEGLRIVQLTDLHVGPHTARSHLARIAHETARARPHLIAHTGDQVDDYPRDMEVFAAAFGTLSAPLGVFAIPGNHDVYAGWSEVRRGLEKMGVTVLVNRAVRLTHNDAPFWLGGTGDPAGAQLQRAGGESAAPDLARTLAQIPRGEMSIVLAHNPALWPPLAAHGVTLTLSGHTHYGQLSTKHWSLASVFLELAMGAHERNGALLYISPGANYWGIPFRIGALPEVSVLTFRRGDSAAIVPRESRAATG